MPLARIGRISRSAPFATLAYHTARAGVGAPALSMLALLVTAALLQAGAPKKIDIVSVTGCLRETMPGTWLLTSATDPAPSSANAPPAKDLPAAPPAGKGQFKLIGVSEFNLPAHKGHTVVVKGLYIKADPVSRLNITSVTMVSAGCVAGAEK